MKRSAASLTRYRAPSPVDFMTSSTILYTESELGTQVVSHGELVERFGLQAMGRVLDRAGIRTRRVAPSGISGSDLGFAAAERLLAKHHIDRASIDLLIFCTQSPDYWLPTTACILQDRLGLGPCAAFDINLGCSQYVYALSVAHSMIVAKCSNRALVITGDTMSHFVNPLDRSVVPLMGDAGTATLVGPAGAGEGFLGFELGTDGSGHQHLMIPAGGARIPLSDETGIETTDAEGNVRSKENLFMNGVAIFHFAISTVPGVIRSLLGKLQLRVEDIDLYLFHQANKYMLDHICKKMGIPGNKTHFYIEDIGNTSGSSLPVVLGDALQRGKIRPGSKVLIIGFGVGLSWGATVVQWPGEKSA